MIRADKTTWGAALAAPCRVSPARATIAILSTVRLTAAADTLAVAGCDLDRMIETRVPVETDGIDTNLCVPAGLLRDIVQRLPDGAVATLTDAGNGRALFKAGRSRFTLPALPVTDFPAIGDDIGTTPYRVDLPAGTLAGILGRVAFAASTEETRYYLCGVHLHTDEGALVFVATDGHRLAMVRHGADHAAAPKIIVPSAAVTEIARLVAAHKNETARLAWTDRMIAVEIGRTRLVSKLIDGTFPDYRRVIPTSDGHEIMMSGQQLADSVLRVLTVSNAERGNAVKFVFSDGSATLSTTNPDAGDAVDMLDAEVALISGEGAEIGFNGRYVQDILSALGDSQIRLTITDPGSPARIAAADLDDTTIVLMPMRA